MQEKVANFFTSIKDVFVKLFTDEYDDVISLDQFDFDLDGMAEPDEFYDN